MSLIQSNNLPLHKMVYASPGICSNTIPTVTVSDIYYGAYPLPCVSRYTLDMSGWEIKTDLVTNKKYIDIYVCLEDFFILNGLSSGQRFGETVWSTKSIQITGDRIIFYKSKGIDADQTSLFQSKLGTIYNQDLPGNSVNCTGIPPPDWNPTTQEESWMYQCGCVNYSTALDYSNVITPIVIKDRLTSLSNIINQPQPILNWTSNTSAPESIILDTGCVINASCGTASQLVSLENYRASIPYTPAKEIYNSKNLDDFIEPKDTKLKGLSFKVTEDDADFNSGTGPYIYFIILPNCGYKEWEDSSIDGVGYRRVYNSLDTGYINSTGTFNLNIGCTPRGAFPCNFTDQECDLCVRAAPATYDYEEWVCIGDSTWPGGGFGPPEGCTWDFQTVCNGDEDRDCHGNCFPKSWLNDDFCHNGKFRHPQQCKYKNPEGECILANNTWENTNGIYSVPEIFLNCPRFANQTKNCSWNDNTAPICKGVCCEVYQGVFTGACTIKSRNECVLYQSLAHPKGGYSTDEGLEEDNSDIKEEQWTFERAHSGNRTIDIEGGYFWEISPKDTVASPTTCSVCSEVKGLSTGCVYFGCCDEVSGVSFCSPSALDQISLIGYNSLGQGNFQSIQYINPNRSRPTNHGIGYYTSNSTKEMSLTTWFNFDYSVVNYYNELLLKTKSDGWWESIVQPVKQELPHTDGFGWASAVGPDYTQNNMGTRVCCINGECSLKTISDCKEAGGFFHINLNVCDNIYCEPDRIGRCCEMFEGVATGNCLLVTKAECEAIGGKNWLIDNLGNPIACTHTDIVTWGKYSPQAGETFEFENPTFHYPDCRQHTQCVSTPDDLRACCLEGGRCATLLISHCKNIGGTPDMLRYSCQQTNPLNGSTPTDITILDCSHATPAHQKYWCDPECINPVCDYFKVNEFGVPVSGAICCGPTGDFDQVSGICQNIIDDLNINKVCNSNWGCGGTDVRCGDKNSGDCHTVHAGPGCKNESCCSLICSEVDPRCCYETWGPFCKEIADLFCA